MIFAHGFNTNFQEALFRLVQMSADARIEGTPVLFSWPSQARVTGYRVDRDSVALSRDDFIVGPSNVAAVRFVDSWPSWPERCGALFGPKGSGKSHLVEVWRAACSALRVPAEDVTPDWALSIADDAAIAIEGSRHLVYHAAALVDQGKYDREWAPYLSIAKTYATETANRVASDAIQILGAQGYMKDHPLERHYRDARQLMIVEGTSQVQRLVIARAMINGELGYW